MLADKLADFGLPPQWSTMREAAVLEQEKGKKNHSHGEGGLRFPGI